MGLLIDCTPHLEHGYYELSITLARNDGETFTTLDLKGREAVYQAVLDTIRARGVQDKRQETG